jgi:membrane protein YqaA with SNARE-associated domain
MSVKTKLARKAVKTTAKHTVHGTASKFTHKPVRSVTLLALGAVLGGIVGWLIGRSGGDEPFEPVAPAGPTSAQSAGTNNSTESVSETGAVS